MISPRRTLPLPDVFSSSRIQSRRYVSLMYWRLNSAADLDGLLARNESGRRFPRSLFHSRDNWRSVTSRRRSLLPQRGKRGTFEKLARSRTCPFVWDFVLPTPQVWALLLPLGNGGKRGGSYRTVQLKPSGLNYWSLGQWLFHNNNNNNNHYRCVTITWSRPL